MYPASSSPSSSSSSSMAASSPSPAPPKARPSQSPPSLESTTVAAEYGRIISAHTRHFLILSLLFLPISFSPFLFPTFHKTLLSSTSAAQIIPLLISSLFISTSYLLAIGSITHSVRHTFHYTTPLTLTSPIKSSISSFFPLFTTALSAQFPVFGTLLLLSRSLFHLSGLQSFLASQALTVGFVIMQLSWGLAYAVAVVESKWGFRAWKRSFDLMMMMMMMMKNKKKEEAPRNTGLGIYYCSLILLDGFNMGLMIWTLTILANGPFPWGVSVLLTCFIIPGLVSTLLYNTTSFAVLCMYLSLDVDEAENNEKKQVQAPLLAPVGN